MAAQGLNNKLLVFFNIYQVYHCTNPQCSHFNSYALLSLFFLMITVSLTSYRDMFLKDECISHKGSHINDLWLPLFSKTACRVQNLKFIFFSYQWFCLFFHMFEKSFPLLQSYFSITCIPCTSTSLVSWYSLYPDTCCHTTCTKKIVRPTATCLTSFPNLPLTIYFFPSFDDHFHNSSFHVCSYRTLALLSYPANKH